MCVSVSRYVKHVKSFTVKFSEQVILQARIRSSGNNVFGSYIFTISY